ncbi:MAG TPA: 30S ribosomal protein S4e [Candidatus Nitrosopolaris sp.]|nr:30S ribosomal protein S4e [Candidatus Nitrosopolaris sp.]
MGKKGGDTRLKRQVAPTFWNIRRKQSQFVLKASPGPHRIQWSYPLGIILRDVLSVATNIHEAKMILSAGKVKVDGVQRRDVKFPVGLMDVIELTPTGQCYRLVPKDSKLLVPVEIQDAEKMLKFVKVSSKVTTIGGKLQYGFHDGKSMISEQPLSVGDTCLLDFQNLTIKNIVRFEKGNLGLITSGDNAGNVGTIEDIKDGLFSLPKRVILALGNRSVELPMDIVMTVGLEAPLIKVN